MELRKEDLPATIQAFELQNDNEIFIAEQVVNSQSEVETFSARYTGKLIKVKKFAVNETGNYSARSAYTANNKKSSSASLIMIVIILIIVALVIYGFSTGWIQEKFNLKV